MISGMRKKSFRVLNSIFFIVIIGLPFTCTAIAQALLQVGTQAPDFSLKDIAGKDHTLSLYAQKKAVVIVFWSTWSSNSIKALKRFEEFHRKYKDKGIQIIGVNAENQTISSEDVANVNKVVRELEISFPILLDQKLSTFHNYDTIALPSSVVISDGKITHELPGLPPVGTEDLFDALMVLAGEQPRKKIEPRYMPRHDAIADTNLGRGFVRKKQYGMAYPFFKKAIEKDPKYMLPYDELARLYETEGNAPEAEGTLRKALSVEPENVVILSDLGYLLSKTGKVKEAIEVLDKAAKLNSYTPSHYYLAYALGKDGRMNESLASFEKSLSLNPFESTIYVLRAEIYEQNKMLKEASADYRKALELLLKIRD
jgi:Tfp pilus assembly protein PilF/peroxiredoxin